MEELIKNIKLCGKIYDYLGFLYENDTELERMIKQDCKHGFLSINKGINDKEFNYIWFYDGNINSNLAVNIKTGELITDEDEISKIFGY